MTGLQLSLPERPSNETNAGAARSPLQIALGRLLLAGETVLEQARSLLPSRPLPEPVAALLTKYEFSLRPEITLNGRKFGFTQPQGISIAQIRDEINAAASKLYGFNIIARGAELSDLEGHYWDSSFDSTAPEFKVKHSCIPVVRGIDFLVGGRNRAQALRQRGLEDVDRSIAIICAGFFRLQHGIHRASFFTNDPGDIFERQAACAARNQLVQTFYDGTDQAPKNVIAPYFCNWTDLSPRAYYRIRVSGRPAEAQVAA